MSGGIKRPFFFFIILRVVGEGCYRYTRIKNKQAAIGKSIAPVGENYPRPLLVPGGAPFSPAKTPVQALPKRCH